MENHDLWMTHLRLRTAQQTHLFSIFVFNMIIFFHDISFWKMVRGRRLSVWVAAVIWAEIFPWQHFGAQ